MRIREILNEAKVELNGRPKPVDAEKANQGYSGGVYFKTEADFNNVILAGPGPESDPNYWYWKAIKSPQHPVTGQKLHIDGLFGTFPDKRKNNDPAFVAQLQSELNKGPQLVAQHNQKLDMLAKGGTAPAQAVATSVEPPVPQNVPKFPGGRAGVVWDRRYGKTHNKDGTPIPAQAVTSKVDPPAPASKVDPPVDPITQYTVRRDANKVSTADLRRKP